MANKVKGYDYEIQVRDFIIQNNSNAFLWNQTPEKILINAGIIGSHNENRLKRKEKKENPLMDTGIDIIEVCKKELILIQCKNGYKNGVTLNDLVGFYSWTAHLPNLKGKIYYTDKLSNAIKSLPTTERIQYIKHEFINQKINLEEIENFEARDYQLDLQQKFNEHFEKENRGTLSMPCGTGKTFSSYLVSKKYKQIIIISPLKQFAKQNLDKFVEYGFSGKTLLIDSDGTRDIKEVTDFIKKNKTFLLSSTFFSVDIIYQIMDKTKDALIIVDEFHNISKTNMTDNNDYFYKLLNSNYRMFFMSATPKIYELEDEENLNEKIFGKIVYNMQFSYAIEKGYITDYRIWLPSIHEDNSKLKKALDIYEISDIIKGKCMYLYQILLNNGSQKMIIYCENTDEITEMREGMKSLNDFYELKIEMGQITSSNSDVSRTKILNEFKNSKDIYLLFSVRILDECIDIPACDSIFITYPSKSKVRTIQRMCRCIRNFNSNPNKIGNVAIWCNEYDEILETLYGIKEYDVYFKEKICVTETNYYGESDKKGIELDKELVDKFTIRVNEYKGISWEERFKALEKYLKENNKRPSKSNEDREISSLGNWTSIQLYNYSKNNLKLEQQKKWDELLKKYNELFLNDEEKWYKNFNELKKFLDDNKRRPIKNDSIHNWFHCQQQNYIKEDKSMKNKIIKKDWEKFNKDYEKILKVEDDVKIWMDTLDKVKAFILKNNAKPISYSKEPNEKSLGQWVADQFTKEKKEIGQFKKNIVKEKWNSFVQENLSFLKSNDAAWFETFNELKAYIDKFKIKPSRNNSDKNVSKLFTWIDTQTQNFDNKTQIMANENIYKIWEKYLIENREILNNKKINWKFNFDELIKFINENGETPKQNSDDENEKKLGEWLSNQRRFFKLKKGNFDNIDYVNQWEKLENIISKLKTMEV